MSGKDPSSSSDLFGVDDPSFLEALANAVLPGDVIPEVKAEEPPASTSHDSEAVEQGKKRPRPDSSPPGSPSDDAFAFGETSYIKSVIHQTGDDGESSSYLESDTYGASKFNGWGDYMRRKRAKLQVQNSEIEEQSQPDGVASKPKIFTGLAIHINGFTVPSVQVLREMITQHGGTYHAYLDKKSLVTHVVASNLTPAKVLDFARMKIVTPEWITKSVEAEKLLPWRDFILNVSEADMIEETRGLKTAQKTLFSGFQTQARKASSSAAAASSDSVSTIPDDTRSRTKSTDEGPDGDRKKDESSSDLVVSAPTRAKPTTPTKGSSTTVMYSTDPVTFEAADHIPHYAAHESNVSAARLMQDPAWAAAHTAASGADFIEGFYQNSRLHHLSTWKAELKELVAKAQAKVDGDSAQAHCDGPDAGVSMAGHKFSLPDGSTKVDGKVKRKPEDRVIMHCDFDSFFVAAGIVDRPHLKGKPVVVCHSQSAGVEGVGRLGNSTSEVASASYEARKFGIKNGMSLGQARKLCPQVETIPYEFEKYKDISLKFYTILLTYADDAQAVSVDEALIDVSNAVARAKLSPRPVGDPVEKQADVAKELAETIRTRVREATGCEVSIGISHNILLARLATRKAKPAGSFHLLPEDISTLLENLDVENLHGVGWSMREKIESNLGITKVGELAMQPKGALQNLFGPKAGEKVWNAARGIDTTQIESHKERRSVSAEVNYGIRFENEEQAERFVRDLAREVSRRLSNISMKGRLMTLKLMKRHPDAPKEAAKFMGHGICDVFNKSAPIRAPGGAATDSPDIIGDEAWKLLKTWGFDPKELRGIGIQIQKLEKVAGSDERRPAGQQILGFQKVSSPVKRSAPDEADPAEPSAKKSKIVSDTPAVMVTPATQLTGTQLALPSASQIDTTVIESLPLSVQAQIKAQLNQASPSTLAVPSEGSVISRDPSPRSDSKETIAALPSFTQLDKSVLAELPPDIRRELEAEYERAQGNSVKQPERLMEASTSKSRSPPKLGKPATDVKHITKQLAPKRNVDRSPAKFSIFKKRDPPPVVQIEVSDEELAVLDIDPDVFRALPGDLQREQLDARRLALELPPRSVAKPKSAVRESRSPSVVPRARAVYKASFPSEPQLSKVSDTSAIRDLVQRWFDSSLEAGPHEKDLKRIGDFLVRCVDMDTGVEKAVVVMRWMRHLFRGRWEETIPSDPGRVWWDAFDMIKARLDAEVAKRFGGKLALD